jgi:hypothetical protein
MTIVQQAGVQSAPGDRKIYDSTILIGYAASAIVFLILIYLSSLSSGTAPGDFASMTAFP